MQKGDERDAHESNPTNAGRPDPRQVSRGWTHETNPIHRFGHACRGAGCARRSHCGQRKASSRGTPRHVRHGLGCRRHPGVQRGGADTRRGPHDLRLRGDRGLRLGDGDRGRVRAVRGRRRRARQASAEAAVAAAAHRILAHYLPAQAPTILDPAYDHIAGHDPRRPGEDRRRRRRRGRRRPAHRRAGRRRVPGAGDVHAAEPADSRGAGSRRRRRRRSAPTSG